LGTRGRPFGVRAPSLPEFFRHLLYRVVYQEWTNPALGGVRAAPKRGSGAFRAECATPKLLGNAGSVRQAPNREVFVRDDDVLAPGLPIGTDDRSRTLWRAASSRPVAGRAHP